jgi:phosphatidylinositol glycan class V
MLVRELARVVRLFVAWKAVLFAVVLLAPGGRDGGYDASTALHFGAVSPPRSAAAPMGPVSAAVRDVAERVVVKLTRWDAVYFTQASAYGRGTEQEWAFGWGFSSAVSRVVGIVPPPLLYSLSC